MSTDAVREIAARFIAEKKMINAEIESIELRPTDAIARVSFDLYSREDAAQMIAESEPNQREDLARFLSEPFVLLITIQGDQVTHTHFEHIDLC